MTIKIPPTNRELAERFGVSTRTVRRATSGRRARDWWPVLRQEMRKEAARLRSTGMTWKQVGEALGGVSESAARSLGKRGSGEWTSGQQPERAERQQDLPL